MAKIRYLGHAVEHQAGEVLGGHRVVVVIGNQAYYADNTNASHLHLIRGITIGATELSSLACIQIGGPLVEPSWNWTPGLPLYVSTNGMLTQTPPTAGFLQQVAIADTATRIFIDNYEPLVLE